MLSAPDVRVELAFDYLGAAWLLLVLPLILGVIEAPLLAMSDRWPRRTVVVCGLVAQAFFLAICSEADRAWIFGLGLAGWGAAGGLTIGVAGAALVEAYPDQRERMLTRWAFLGSLGDAVAPAFVATSFAITGSWRGALAAAAAGYALHGAWVLATMPDNRPAASSDDDGDESLRTALARGLKNPSLMSWLGATALCTLLDEILLAFGSLYLREVHGASPALQATAFTAFAIGCGVGLLLTDRALTRVPPERVLIASCIVCIAAYAAWLAIDSSIASVLLLGLVGLGTGPLHPLAQARAYAAHAERPGVVAALEMLYSPIELLAPLIIGAFADRYGLGPALALLALQPIAILAMAWSARTHRSAPA